MAHKICIIVLRDQRYLISILHLIDYLILALVVEGYVETGIDSEGPKDTSVIPMLLFSLHAITSCVMDRSLTLSVQKKRYIVIVIKEQQGK